MNPLDFYLSSINSRKIVNRNERIARSRSDFFFFFLTYTKYSYFLGGKGERITRFRKVTRATRWREIIEASVERRSESGEFAGCPNLSPRPARTALHRGSVTRGSRLPLGVIWPLRSEQRSGQRTRSNRTTTKSDTTRGRETGSSIGAKEKSTVYCQADEPSGRGSRVGRIEICR